MIASVFKAPQNASVLILCRPKEKEMQPQNTPNDRVETREYPTRQCGDCSDSAYDQDAAHPFLRYHVSGFGGTKKGALV